MDNNEVNKTSLYGRLARDPNFSRKEGSVKAVFFTVATSRPFTGRDGIAATATDYVDVKVFDVELAATLDNEALKQGDVVAVTGRGGAEVSEFEKDGEKRVRAKQLVIIEHGSDHAVKIERA